MVYRIWEPGKCLLQAPKASRYTVNTIRIEEQTQYMRDHALIGKFLGLWSSERDLEKWIHHWWKPKGHYELQLGSKGFFIIIFLILKIESEFLMEVPISSTLLSYS
jgi:hypothetical protein